MNHAEAVDVSPGSYDKLIERMLEQLNMGYCFEELIDSVYDQLHGIVPYNRIAVALLEEETNLLRLTSCRSDGKIALKVGYAARLEGSTLSTLLQTGQLRHSENHYRLLIQLSQIVNSSLDVRKVFEYAATQIHTLLDACDRVSLLLTKHRETSRHGFVVEFNGDEKHWGNIPSRAISGSVFDWVMEHRMQHLSRSLEGSEQFSEDQILFKLGYGSKVYLPLLSREQSVGVLGIASRRVARPLGLGIARRGL